jgi:hypothetical protein
VAGPVFSVSHVLDEGVSHPKVAQFGPGMMEIIDGTTLDKPKKDALKQECFEIMEFLVRAERLLKPLITEIEAIETEFKERGPNFASGDRRTVRVPQSMHLNNARDALAYYRRILTRVARAVGRLYGKEFDGPYLHKVAKAVAAKHGKDHRLYKFIMENQSLVNFLLNELRNEDEHPKSLGPFIKRFAVKADPAGGIQLVPPLFHNGEPVKETLAAVDTAVYQFAMGCFVLALADHLQPFNAIHHIPPDKRDPTMPIEAKLAINPAAFPGVPVQISPGYTVTWPRNHSNDAE